MLGDDRFLPAPEMLEWVRENVISEGGPLHNPEHRHLEFIDLAFLWADVGFAKQGRIVLGQAEEVTFRVSGWHKLRQEQQMIEWFGRVPQFLVTLAADFCRSCTDVEFCALVEHELYHIGQERDSFGALKFKQDGSPKMSIRAHDVEEFIGVVRRYGPSSDVAKMLDAAKGAPEASRLNIARACGCCLKAA